MIMMKKGRPSAVVAPEDFEALTKEREQGFSAIDRIRARNSDKEPAEVEKDVTEVVETVRQEMCDEGNGGRLPEHSDQGTD